MTGRAAVISLVLVTFGGGCGHRSTSPPETAARAAGPAVTEPAVAITIPSGADSSPWWTTAGTVIPGRPTTAILPTDLLFAVDSADLSANADDALGRLLADAVGTPTVVLIEIEGHTDSDGAAAYNQHLSEARASAVGQWLVTSGIEERRITTRGWGASRPIVPNTDAVGKARNRRVEVTLRSAP